MTSNLRLICNEKKTTCFEFSVRSISCIVYIIVRRQHNLLRFDIIFITHDLVNRTKVLYEMARLSSWSALANTLSSSLISQEPIRAKQVVGLAVSAANQSTHDALCATQHKYRANEVAVDALARLYKRGSQSREHQSVVPKGTRRSCRKVPVYDPSTPSQLPQFLPLSIFLKNKVNVN